MPSLCHFLSLSHYLHTSPLPAFYFLISLITSLSCLSKFILFFLLLLIHFLISALLFPFFLHLLLLPLLPFLNSDIHPAATALLSAFEHKISLDLSVQSNLPNVLFQTGVKTGMAAVCKICKRRIFATSWCVMSLYSYFRKSSLTIIFFEVPDLEFNSQYVNQHRLFLAPAPKNNFGIDARINYCKQVLMALCFFSDHACLDLRLKPNLRLTWLGKPIPDLWVPESAMKLHLHVWTIMYMYISCMTYMHYR